MTKALLGAVLAVAIAAPVRADVKMTQNVGGKGMGIGGNSQSVTYIKGLKMRSDTKSGDTIKSMVFDVENQKLYMFDSKKKEADVWDMADFAKQIGTAVDTSEAKTSFTANGQTKQVAGKTATGYDMSISMPAKFGDPKDGIAITVTLAGPTWIVKGAPGTEDFRRFYLAAAERGFIFSDPRGAKAQPGQAKALTTMYREMAATGGVPYETEMNIKMSGEGPMGAMLGRMGISMTNTMESIESTTLTDDFFAPPAGYKLNPKK